MVKNLPSNVGDVGSILGRRSRSHTPQNNQAGSQHQSACHHNKNPVQTKKKKNPQTLYTNQRIVIDEATDCSDKPNKRQASGINAWKTPWGPVAKALSFKMIEEREFITMCRRHTGDSHLKTTPLPAFHSPLKGLTSSSSVSSTQPSHW